MDPQELLDTFVQFIRDSNMTQEGKRQAFQYIRILRTLFSNGVYTVEPSAKCSEEFKDP